MLDPGTKRYYGGHWTAQRPTAYTELVVVVVDTGPVGDQSSLTPTHQILHTYGILGAIHSESYSISITMSCRI